MRKIQTLIRNGVCFHQQPLFTGVVYIPQFSRCSSYRCFALQPPWEPHRRRCFLRSKMLGKNHAVCYFRSECYSSHPFNWNFGWFLTCISRWAVASRIEQVQFFFSILATCQNFFKQNSRFWFRWCDFIPQKLVVVGAVFCAHASRCWSQICVEGSTSKRLGTQSGRWCHPHPTLHLKALSKPTNSSCMYNIWYLHSLKTGSLPLKKGLPAPKSTFHLYNHPF